MIETETETRRKGRGWGIESQKNGGRNGEKYRKS